MESPFIKNYYKSKFESLFYIKARSHNDIIERIHLFCQADFKVRHLKIKSGLKTAGREKG
jgi:hypothetical protein